MGMYTQLSLHVELKDTAQVDVLQYMVRPNRGRLHVEITTPDHPLFTTDTRWTHMLSGDSYYFEGNTHSAVVYDAQAFWSLDVYCNFKNYDNELGLFLDWLYPQVDNVAHSSKTRFVGYSRYEKDADPTLIYWTPNGFESRAPKATTGDVVKAITYIEAQVDAEISAYSKVVP